MRKNDWVMRVLLTSALVLGLGGCGDDIADPPEDGDEDGGKAGSGGAGGTGGNSGSGGNDGGAGSSGSGGTGGSDDDGGTVVDSGSDTGVDPIVCGDVADRQVVAVSGDMTTDTHWTCDKVYEIGGSKLFVVGATLTIDPGTLIKGKHGSALVVTNEAKVIAEGTKEAPIVFTSSQDEGFRARGDWGGIVLLGKAPLNLGGVGQVEGLPVGDVRGQYGGSDDEHDCGTLKYVRVEFGGFAIAANNELNGVTVGGCGSDTTLDYIQSHSGADDGVEFFGGTANIKHLVVTGPNDDGLDWDFGWTGKVQFVVVQQYLGAGGDSGFEADNHPSAFDSVPRAMPTIFNATLLGPDGDSGQGMVLRRGTWGTISNAIVAGFKVEAIDVRDAATVAGTTQIPVALSVNNSIFFDIGTDNVTYFGTELTDGTGTDDDTGFVESTFFMDAARSNRFGTDPELGAPYNQTAPNFVPAAASPAATGAAATPSDAFFTTANYVGAFEPGGADWTAGWTAYPED